MAQVIEEIGLSEVAKGVVRTLLYYDIFYFPLTFGEICQNLTVGYTDEAEVAEALQLLISSHKVFQYKEYYQLQALPQRVERREQGGRLAKKYLTKARQMTRLIAAFPFVRSISISGSLSKGYMDAKGDIDYFIITRSGRLWLSRTLLVAFKKLFLFNSFKYFCVNYFVDEEHLEIEEKNIYAAIELVTLIPTFGADFFEAMERANSWTARYLPNYAWHNTDKLPSGKPALIKRSVEWLLGGRLGNALDDLCMRITVNHWKKKFHDYNPDDFGVAFKSRKHVSKHHPSYFQKQVLDALDKKVKEFEQQHKVSLA